jgi:2-oxoglutarate dehydrogenase complex dehydrogenase (E1) component-like enzyme
MNDKHDYKPEMQDPFYKLAQVNNPQHKTGTTKTVLNEVFKIITTVPAEFNVHPTIKKIFEERVKNFNNN